MAIVDVNPSFLGAMFWRSYGDLRHLEREMMMRRRRRRGTEKKERR